ncbi:MAG TPA: hypothetical protein VL400_15660, partial [Polyangiaceae bacterium]|nr:hypothetical protein [Polyangiaceae bacterium]
EPAVGVRGVDDTLIQKSGEAPRRTAVRTSGPKDDVRPVDIHPADGVAQASEVPRRATPVGEIDLARLLVSTHKTVFGEPPTLARISVAWAHLALEHQRGAGVDDHNFGNISVGDDYVGPYFLRQLAERQRDDAKAALGGWKTVGMRFAAFPDDVAGVTAYWRLLEAKYGSALKLFDVGNAHNAGRKLAELGYATAYPEPYAVSMSDLQGEFRRRILPAAAELDVKRDFEGKLERPGD